MPAEGGSLLETISRSSDFQVSAPAFVAALRRRPGLVLIHMNGRSYAPRDRKGSAPGALPAAKNAGAAGPGSRRDETLRLSELEEWYVLGGKCPRCDHDGITIRCCIDRAHAARPDAARRMRSLSVTGQPDDVRTASTTVDRKARPRSGFPAAAANLEVERQSGEQAMLRGIVAEAAVAVVGIERPVAEGR